MCCWRYGSCDVVRRKDPPNGPVLYHISLTPNCVSECLALRCIWSRSSVYASLDLLMDVYVLFFVVDFATSVWAPSFALLPRMLEVDLGIVCTYVVLSLEKSSRMAKLVRLVLYKKRTTKPVLATDCLMLVAGLCGFATTPGSRSNHLPRAEFRVALAK